MPTKAELTQEVQELKKALHASDSNYEELINSINTFIQTNYSDFCQQGKDYIEEFYTSIGIEKPTTNLTIEVPSGFIIPNRLSSFPEIEDDEGEWHKYKILEQ
jgi:hypothetical protein